MMLDILIPTFNRAEPLIKNLELIQKYLEDIADEFDVSLISVLISDNGSEDCAFDLLKEYLETKYKYNYHLFRQEKNIGVEENVIFLIEHASADYVMTLGDDDYFSIGYLRIVLDYIKEGRITGIVPNYYIVDETEKPNGIIRDPIDSDKEYTIDDIWICERGHQLSCLVFKRDGVVDSYKKNCRSSPYPFLYFLAYNLEKGNLVHVTKEPFKNTVISKKNWNYDFDKLMGELAIAIDCLPYKNSKSRSRNTKIIVERNAYRFCNFETYKHPMKAIRKISRYKVSGSLKWTILNVYFRNFPSVINVWIKSKVGEKNE